MSQEKKKEILHNAVDLFQKNGYEKVTVNDIAKASGISKNTFYYYFDSKESLILELFHPDQDVTEKLMFQIINKDTAYDQLLLIYKNGASYFNRLGKEIMKTALKLNLTKDMLSRKPARRPIYELIKKLYVKAQEEGTIRTDISIQEIADCTCIALMGCLQIWATSPVNFDLTDAFMKAFDVIVKKQS